MNGVHSPVSVGFKRCDNFENGGSGKTLERLGRGINLAALGGVQSLADIALHSPRKGL